MTDLTIQVTSHSTSASTVSDWAAWAGIVALALLFGFMVAALAPRHPAQWLVPVVVVLGVTTAVLELVAVCLGLDALAGTEVVSSRPLPSSSSSISADGKLCQQGTDAYHWWCGALQPSKVTVTTTPSSASATEVFQFNVAANGITTLVHSGSAEGSA